MQSSVAPVFYQSKVGPHGELSHTKIAGEIEWGKALDLIKHEGFYMFGGKNEKGEGMNTLYIIQIKEDKHGAINFSIQQPKMLGKPPPKRHSSTLTFMPKLGQMVIVGGRNDQSSGSPVLNDIWLITLSNMEYHQVKIGGENIPIPRSNHQAIVNGS